jgi:Family of unknown function (DUF5941)
MSATVAIASARAERPTALAVYRDDGPLARALGAAVGASLPLPALALVAAGLLPLIVVMAVGGDDVSRGVAAAVVGWLVLAAGASSGRPHCDRLRWLVAPALRFGEYAGLLWLAALDGAVPGAFALLAALAFRHYDLVYRLRQRGDTPPAWLNTLAGGWDGRLVLGWVLLAAGALPAAFYVLAGVLVGESAAGWARAAPGVYEHEEDEAP